MEKDAPRLDSRSAKEQLAQAETFERLADKFKDNRELSEAFRNFAQEVREQVLRLRS